MGTYSGNRMAFLAVSKGQLPFYTLQEVADDTCPHSPDWEWDRSTLAVFGKPEAGIKGIGTGAVVRLSDNQ